MRLVNSQVIPPSASRMPGPEMGFDSDKPRILWQIGSLSVPSRSKSNLPQPLATANGNGHWARLRPMLEGRCTRKL
jgi:hypothetical protein